MFVVTPMSSNTGASGSPDVCVYGLAASTTRPESIRDVFSSFGRLISTTDAKLRTLRFAWVEGATTTGANDLVVLANPGSVPATVQLSVYGAQGLSSPPSGQNIVVAAGQRRVVPLAGLLLGEESPVVRVESAGAPVHASLQASLTRLLLPGGSDQVAPLAEADTRLVMPGVQVLTTGEGQAGTVLRLLSPASDTTASVTLTPVDAATAAPAPVEIPLTAGLPTSYDLSGLAAGVYTVDVSAGAPIVGATWSTTGFGEGADFAWYAPAPETTTGSVVAVAPGAGSSVVLAGGDADAAVTLTPVEGGTPVSTTVSAGTTVSVPVDAAVYRLETSAPVRAAVTYSGDGALAAYPLWPADAAASALTILP